MKIIYRLNNYKKINFKYLFLMETNLKLQLLKDYANYWHK